MKEARIVMRNYKGRHPNGGANEAEMALKAGAKGTGRDIHVVKFWPWSAASKDAAYQAMREVAGAKGYKIV